MADCERFEAFPTQHITFTPRKIHALQSGSLSSFDAGRLAAAANTGLQEVADTIRAATSAGVSVDLEATAQGLGYGSFADAVAAYNQQYGTNYSVEEAKESLGQ